MDESDLLRHLQQVSDRRHGESNGENSGSDDSDGASVYESAIARPGEAHLPKTPAGEPIRKAVRRSGEAVRRVAADIRKSAPGWFDTTVPDTSANSRRFPLSAFAAILTVAVSMALIVAGSLTVTRAEREIDKTRAEIKRLNRDIDELRSAMESDEDLLRIREIAVREYGMVGEEFVRKEYLVRERRDRVELFGRDGQPAD